MQAPIKHIYIHFPFCVKKCPYCSFYSVNYNQKKAIKYLKIIKEEYNCYHDRFVIEPETIYFGGGTPSLLDPDQLADLLTLLSPGENTEITLEINPINVNENYLSSLKRSGINRLSLGVQSMIDKELQLLGRLHDSDQVRNSIRMIQTTGFENTSFDLIYGLPDQKLAEVKHSLIQLLAYRSQHFSVYCLSLDQHVPLFKISSRIPSDELVSSMYYQIRKMLLAAGFEQYEISNFCLPGFQSRHNTAYWNNKEYLGLGASASGYIAGKRYKNPSDLEKYKRNIRQKMIFPASEKLSPEEREKEFIFLNLRKAEGIDPKIYGTTFGQDFSKKYRELIDKLSVNGFLEINKGKIRLTAGAYFVSDEIFKEFFLYLDKINKV